MRHPYEPLVLQLPDTDELGTAGVPRLRELFRRLEMYSSRSCIEGTDVKVSYAGLLAETTRWGACLENLGVRAGSVVALRADYSPEAIAALLAVLWKGAVAALIPRNQSITASASEVLASIVVDIDSDGSSNCNVVDPPPASHPLLERLRSGAESGLIVFTSGTTGRPKAALHSLERFLSKFGRPGRSLRTLGFLLFDHIAGLDTLFYTLWNGGTLIITRHRDPQSIIKMIGSHQVEVLPVSPTFLRLLCATKDQKTDVLSSLKVITYGSEPMDSTTLRRVHQRFQDAQILQKYGTSEFGSPRTASRGNGDLWVKIKDIETKIIDGILWVRGEATMLGYLNAPSPILEDGWYCTGDLVQLDGEWIRFIGRADEMIKVGGEKVVPAEVERVIRELDFVKDVVISADSHLVMGQVVAARVVIAPSALTPHAIAAQIRALCRERLGPHHMPLRVDFASGPLRPPGYRYKRQHPSTTD
jgi:long-chain acyl-CoA synthetase